jgi:hypothetical protein
VPVRSSYQNYGYPLSWDPGRVAERVVEAAAFVFAFVCADEGALLNQKGVNDVRRAYMQWTGFPRIRNLSLLGPNVRAIVMECHTV